MKKYFLLALIILLIPINTTVFAEEIETKAFGNINFKDSPKEVFEKVLEDSNMSDMLHSQTFEYNSSVENELNKRKEESGVKYLAGTFTVEAYDFIYLFLFNDEDQLINIDINGNKYNPNNEEEWDKMIDERDYFTMLIAQSLISKNQKGNPQIMKTLNDYELEQGSTAWTHIWTKEQLNQHKEIKVGINIGSEGDKEMLKSVLRIKHKKDE